MAKSTKAYLSELLHEYHLFTHKTYSEMALEFDIAPSNLYKYRAEKGNPRADTIDKIVNEIERLAPEVYEKVKR